MVGVVRGLNSSNPPLLFDDIPIKPFALSIRGHDHPQTVMPPFGAVARAEKYCSTWRVDRFAGRVQ
jgi:hypothetical protein